MKTFKQFLYEASATQRLKIATAKLIAKNPDNSVYKTLLDRIRERQAPLYPDYPGRESARKDKTLIPSGRTSSFPELEGISTRTKNPKKLKKQKALGEIEEQKFFSSRAELEKHYGGVPAEKYPNNAGSSENPKWRLKPKSGGVAERTRRAERLVSITGTQTPEEQRKTAKKRTLAKQKGKEVHHQTELERSAKEFKGLSPEQIEAKKKADAKKGKYHGEDRRNLTLANPSGTSTDSPGFHHSRYHAFERRNRGKLKDIETAISPSRAFTTLTNKERKQNKS